jgi:type I restriction enzyme M protein
LVAQIAIRHPKIVLDLGSGGGALSQAAATRWRNAKIHAVEGDFSASTNHSSASLVRTYQADALAPNLSKAIGVQLGTVQAAVCNPPFIRPRWRRHFSKILKESGLADCYSAFQDAGAAVLFLGQNLRFLKDGGELGLIVPDGIVSGHSHRKLRQLLLGQHSIVDIIELPPSTFRSTEVKSHILIVRKNSQGSAVRLRRLEPDGQLSSPRFASATDGVHRLDFSYYQNRLPDLSQLKPPRLVTRVADLKPELQRGRASTSDFASMPPIVHTTNLSADPTLAPGKRFRWSKRMADAHNQVLAWPGDILLARVGRNLEHKVAILRDGPVAISDCVYRLRVEDSVRRRVWTFLISAKGREALSVAASGSAARHLSRAELMALPLW